MITILRKRIDFKANLRRYVCVLGAIFFLIFILRLGYNLYYNYMINYEYIENKVKSSYQERMPMEEIDLSLFSQYFPQASTLLAYNYNNSIELPFTLFYYIEADEKSSAVVELPKGTKVITIYNDSLERGYGFIGYPTYKKGWRYVRPLIEDGEENNIDVLPYYYVRTKDLEKIFRKVFENNKSFQTESKRMKLSKEKYINNMVRFIDKTFYNEGVYLSPDLYRNLIDAPGYVLFLGSSMLLLVSLINKRYLKVLKK